MNLPAFKSNTLSALPGINHGFFGREGGVSEGIYASLNCGLGSADDQRAVAENRSRIAAAMDVAPAQLLSLYQHHSPDVVTVDQTWVPGNGPKGDAMITNQPGIALAIATADCVPVLFADAENRIIGAAHAGWRGALGGVLQNTVEAMVALGANRTTVRAVVGPCIHQSSYQVGYDVRDAFTSAKPGADQFFAPDASEANKYRFDLAGFVHAALAEAGLTKTDDIGLDTYADTQRFFSYRRTTHNHEPDYGRSLSAIALTDAV